MGFLAEGITSTIGGLFVLMLSCPLASTTQQDTADSYNQWTRTSRRALFRTTKLDGATSGKSYRRRYVVRIAGVGRPGTHCQL